MSTRWYLARRVAWTVFAAYLLLSGSFFLFAYTPDPNVDRLEFFAGASAGLMSDANESEVEQAQNSAVQAYREARNYDEPVLERYTNWIVDYATLDWGWSVSENKPVTDAIAERLPFTLSYLLPAIVLAVLGGVGLGLYSALHHRSLADYVITTTAYAGFGLPVFWLGTWALVVGVERLQWYQAIYDDRFGLFTVQNLGSMTLPMVVVAVSLLAVQARYTRAESLEFTPAEFVKTLRANGASGWTVARHVLKNASLPLVSLFFTETLTVMFVTIYVVEVVFSIPGVGQLAYDAIEARDIGVILATTLIPAFVGLFGNLAQDVVYAVIDPRVGEK